MEQEIIKGQTLRDVAMKRYTSMKVGGAVSFLCYPEDEDDLRRAVDYFRVQGKPFRFLGNGTNVIVADKGMDIGVIRATRMGRLHFTKTSSGALVDVSAGTALGTLIRQSASRQLSGIEKLYGIPGTVGGAIRMNAGSFGAAISDCLRSLTYLDANGAVRTIEKSAISFGYRTSPFHSDECILSAVFELNVGERTRIDADMEFVRQERLRKHPLEFPSAGSIFKNRDGHPSWKYIDEGGLRGLKIGGAAISEKHPNFIINTGKAQARDVKQLIDAVTKTVYEKTGVTLETEVEMWGFDD